MSLQNIFTSLHETRILLTEGRKDVIIEKIGLTEDIYNWIVKNIDKKFHIWVANAIRDYIETQADLMPERTIDQIKNNMIRDGSVKAEDRFYFERLEWVIKEIFKRDQKPDINIRDYDTFLGVRKLANQWSTIKDFFQGVTPQPNLKEMEWDEAFEKAVDWHDNLKASGLSTDIKEVAPDAEIIHEFDDGYKWVDMHTSDCRDLGDLMGHCARTDADTMLQLITNDGKFKVTVAFDYDGEYRQAKSTQNNKPSSKYDKYMTWLFTNGGEYQLKSYTSEYRGADDYVVDDLPEETYNEVMDKYPELEANNWIGKAERLFDEGEKDKAIEVLNDNIGTGYYGNFALVTHFYNDDFYAWATDVAPMDLDDIFNKEVFSFEYVEVASYQFTEDVEQFLELGGQDSKALIKSLNKNIDLIGEKEYDMEIDKSLPYLLKSFPKDIVNNIIINIVKENPELYKGDMNKSREILIEDIIRRKVDSDKQFEITYQDIIRKAGLGFDISSIKYEDVSFKTQAFKEMVEYIFEYGGFSFTGSGEDAGYWYVQYIDDLLYGYEGDAELVSAHMDLDRIYESVLNNVEYSVGDLSGEPKDTYNELVQYAEKLRKTHSEVKSEEVVIRWLLDIDPTRELDDLLLKQFVSDGYLDSTLIGGDSNDKQTQLDI